MRLVIVVLYLAQTEASRRRFGDLNKEYHLEEKTKSSDNVKTIPLSDLGPIDFKNIDTHGYGDPTSPLKTPIDLLERYMTIPKNREEAIKLLSKTPKQNIQYLKRKKPMKPSDHRNLSKHSSNAHNTRIIYSTDYHPDDIQEDEQLNNQEKNVTKPTWINFAEILERNVQFPKIPSVNKKNTRNNERTISPDQNNYNIMNTEENRAVYDVFSKHSYDLKIGMGEEMINWTTCDEFAKDAYFHPKDIVNLNWVPFYVWTTRPMVMAIVHKFSVPTKKLVRKYVEELGIYINKSIVDWEQPKLLLRESKEMLLIAKDRRGLFVAITYQELPSSVKGTSFELPLIMLRLKIEDPYLAMTYCDDEYANIMAIESNVPQTSEEKVAEAESLGFIGRGFPVFRDVEKEIIRARVEKDMRLADEERKIINLAPYNDRTVEIPLYK